MNSNDKPRITGLIEPLVTGLGPDNRIEVTLRKTVRADAYGLVELVKSVAAEKVYITPEEYPYSPETEGQFLVQAWKNGSARFVADHEGRVVGECSIFRELEPKRAHTAECQLLVLREYRRMGLGRALMNYAEKWARDAKILKLHLRVFATNRAAAALYESLGYEIEGTLKGQVRVNDDFADEYIMTKFINPVP